MVVFDTSTGRYALLLKGILTYLKRNRLDYKSLLELLPSTSPQVAQTKRSLQLLEPRQQAAQKKEMAEMTGKLKNLGNSILGTSLFPSLK
jgi:hypothetical protein